MKYQVGKLEYPEKADPEFDDYQEAIKHATDQSIDDSVYGIWDMDSNADLLAIVFQCEVFEK